MLRKRGRGFSGSAGKSKRHVAPCRRLAVERLEERSLLTAMPTLTTLSVSAGVACLRPDGDAHGHRHGRSAQYRHAHRRHRDVSQRQHPWARRRSPPARPRSRSPRCRGHGRADGQLQRRWQFRRQQHPIGPNSIITTVAGGRHRATAAITVRPPPPNCTGPGASRWTPPGTSSSPTPGTTGSAR